MDNEKYEVCVFDATSDDSVVVYTGVSIQEAERLADFLECVLKANGSTASVDINLV